MAEIRTTRKPPREFWEHYRTRSVFTAAGGESTLGSDPADHYHFP